MRVRSVSGSRSARTASATSPSISTTTPSAPSRSQRPTSSPNAKRSTFACWYELPKPQLLATFSREETSCLFATAGLFQGIDVPGASLSLVTIDRLPFARPDDPLLEARRERAGPNAFRLIDLPRAATTLAQAAGRLIRSSTDRGVVAVLDPRLAKAGYRWDIVRALPPMRRTRHRAEAEAFLRSLAGPADD
jgi:ATP-dependent DNA helicase DinG